MFGDKTSYMANIAYLFPPMESIIIYKYLTRIGVDLMIGKDQAFHHLFICYTPSELPRSFEQLSLTFPDLSRLDHVPGLGHRLILVVSFSELGKVLDFASDLSCRFIFDQLNEQLRRAYSPNFRIRNLVWTKKRPKIMGIINITPDSFYDGGKHYQKQNYAKIAEKMIASGADIIDIGGESTRPGSKSIDASEELRRVLPVVTQIRRRFEIPISVDTIKPAVADEVLKAGADLINDVSGLSAGREMLDIVKCHHASYCLMHTQGTPEIMQKDPSYKDVLAEVYDFFQKKLAFCETHGLKRDRVLLDPGIGFGKKTDHNLDLLRFISVFSNLECLILQGSSNKSFIGRLLKREVNQRLSGTLATQSLGWVNGASVFRVHQVAENKDVTEIAAIYTSCN